MVAEQVFALCVKVRGGYAIYPALKFGKSVLSKSFVATLQAGGELLFAVRFQMVNNKIRRMH